MKNNFKKIIMTLLVCGFVFPAVIGAVSSMEFLAIVPDGRSAGMGDAGVCLYDTVNTIFHNPAGIGTAKKMQLSVSHSIWIEGMSIEHLAFIYPIKKIGTIGASGSFLWSGDKLPGFSMTGVATGDSLAYQNLVAGLSYGSPSLLGKKYKIFAGAGFKFFQTTVGPESFSFILADAGVLWSGVMGSSLNIGVCGQNIPIMKALSEIAGINFKAGISYEFLLARTKKALMGLIPEVDFNTLNSTVNGGVEFIYRLIPQKIETDVRVGYAMKRGYDVLSSLSFGAGLKYKTYGIDYAFNPMGVLGSSHKLSFVVSF